jgi:hypothetical protein
LFVLFFAKHEDFFAGDAGFDVGFPGDVGGEADEGEAEENGEPDDLHGVEKEGGIVGERGLESSFISRFTDPAHDDFPFLLQLPSENRVVELEAVEFIGICFGDGRVCGEAMGGGAFGEGCGGGGGVCARGVDGAGGEAGGGGGGVAAGFWK